MNLRIAFRLRTLLRADGLHVIDVSELSIEEIALRILRHVEQRTLP